ncbi:hypothetical protein EVAR_13498_1 [Eumeta japonica]|uniref:Uncharacterized protein n=1 Tax=Eumeta variegata TaxID=151549 RepID=A0A4C1UY40_EUMVA|nr:hypothetical protein EVAR_13498_1 [Eumeta japonica]
MVYLYVKNETAIDAESGSWTGIEAMIAIGVEDETDIATDSGTEIAIDINKIGTWIMNEGEIARYERGRDSFYVHTDVRDAGDTQRLYHTEICSLCPPFWEIGLRNIVPDRGRVTSAAAFCRPGRSPPSGRRRSLRK